MAKRNPVALWNDIHYACVRLLSPTQHFIRSQKLFNNGTTLNYTIIHITHSSPKKLYFFIPTKLKSYGKVGRALYTPYWYTNLKFPNSFQNTQQLANFLCISWISFNAMKPQLFSTYLYISMQGDSK